jgi:lipopolysaccharide export system protein LptC
VTFADQSTFFVVPNERARAISAARRHSRIVRALRLALPLLIVALPLLAALPMLLTPEAELPDLDLAGIGLTGTGITMEKPRMTGFSDNRRGYEVTASRAEQNLLNPGVLGLFSLEARMDLQGNGWAVLAAEEGVLDTKAEALDLRKDIRLDTDKGDRVRMSEANIRFPQEEIISNAPVELASGSMTLTAASMRVTENGDAATFEGSVVMILQPQGSATAPTRTAQ